MEKKYIKYKSKYLILSQKKNLIGGYPFTSFTIDELLALIEKIDPRELLNNLITYITVLRDKIISKKDEFNNKLEDVLDVDMKGKNEYRNMINIRYKECMEKHKSDNKCQNISNYYTVDNSKFISKFINDSKQKNILEHKILQYTKIIEDLKKIISIQEGGVFEVLEHQLFELNSAQKIYDIESYNFSKFWSTYSDEQYANKIALIKDLKNEIKTYKKYFKDNKIKLQNTQNILKLSDTLIVQYTIYSFDLSAPPAPSSPPEPLEPPKPPKPPLVPPAPLDPSIPSTAEPSTAEPSTPPITLKKYVETYISEIKKFCNKNLTPSLNIFIREILEYLYKVLTNNEIVDNEIVGIPPLNIIILGTPGIGKSYISKQIATFLSLTKLLPIGKLISIKKTDVIGQYIGQTAPKTYELLLSGIGNICFIDEAYSFAGQNTSTGYDKFGKEFIDALVDFMSEHTGLISIIAAGYKKEMQEQFIDVNNGISRRFPTQINIMRYKYEEFIKLFEQNSNLEKLCEKLGYPKEYNIIFNLLMSYIIKHFYIYKTNMTSIKYKYLFVINDNKYLINIYSESERILIAYLLLKCNIKHGDLFINQFSDLIQLINIMKTVLIFKSKDEINLDDIINNIITSYIKTKTDAKVEYYKVKINKIFDGTSGVPNDVSDDALDNESSDISSADVKKKTYHIYITYYPRLNKDDIKEFMTIKDLFYRSLEYDKTMNIANETKVDGEIYISQINYDDKFKKYINNISRKFIDIIDNTSDFILFTKEELENNISLLESL
jgi:hypothetical protein